MLALFNLLRVVVEAKKKWKIQMQSEEKEWKANGSILNAMLSSTFPLVFTRMAMIEKQKQEKKAAKKRKAASGDGGDAEADTGRGSKVPKPMPPPLSEE